MKFLAAIPEYCVSLLRRLREHWRQFRATSHPKTLKFEIMVLYTLILGIILIMFSGMFYVILARTLYQELDNELRLKAQTISQNIRSYLEAHEEKEDALKFAVENTIARSDQTMRRWWYIGFERRWFKRLDEQNLASDYVTFVNMKGDVLAQSPNLDEGLLRIFLKEPIDRKSVV